MYTQPGQHVDTVLKKRHRVRTVFLSVVGIFLLGFAGIVAYMEYITPGTVERIYGRKVTLDMVMGKNLPPHPSIEWVNVYADGYDENENGIRDDVELEIHRRHPDSARIRAAQLQYAMAMQSRMVDVFNEPTYIAAAKEVGRGLGCIQDVFPLSREGLPTDRPIHEWTEEEVVLSDMHSANHNKLVDPLGKEVETLMLNTERRREQYIGKVQFAATRGTSEKSYYCDIDLSTLPN